MLKNLTVYKRKEVKAATHPTHDLVAMDEKYENKTIVGSLWTKVAKDEQGNDYKFLSGMLQSNKTGSDGKEYKGYVLISQDEYETLINPKENPKDKVDIGEATLEQLEEIF